MRIVIFAAYYHPHIGGYEKDIHELSKRLVQRGHAVCVVACNTEKVSELDNIDGVSVVRLPVWHLLNKTFPVVLPDFKTLSMYFNKCDVVLTQTRFFSTSLLGMLFAKINRIPLIHVERGAYHSVVENKMVNLISHVYDHTIGRLIVRSVLVNIGVSNATCNFIRHIGGKHTKVIYNGIDVGGNRLKHSIVTIAFVGRLTYGKGVQDLIKAFDDSWKLHSDIKLLIVGAGSYRDQLESMVSELRCRNNVQFLGEKNRQGVNDILSVTDIFVNPSYSEGLPSSVLEAASVGLPIVATNVGGTKEIIRNGVSGIIVKPHNSFQLHKAIEYFLNKRDSAKAMGITAKTLLNHKFNWGKITDQYEELFKEIVK